MTNNSFEYDTPKPLNSEEFIDLIKNKYEISISKGQEDGVSEFLNHFSYRRLQPFLRKKQGKNISEVFILYKINEFITHNLSKLILPIELNIKHMLSNEIINHLKEKDIEDPAFYYLKYNDILYKKDNETAVNDWLKKFKKDISRYEKNDIYITESLEKYDNKLPIWTAMDKITFGVLSSYINLIDVNISKDMGRKLLMPEGNNYDDCDQFPKVTAIFSLIRSINVLRNKVSHSAIIIFNNHSNLSIKSFAKKDVQILKQSITNFDDDLIFQKNNNGLKNVLFWQILSMKYFYQNMPLLHKKRFNNFLIELNTILNNYQFEKDISFPASWHDILKIK